jgi:hypothetical protein
MPIFPLLYNRSRRQGQVLITDVETTLAIPQQIDRLALQLGCEVDWSRAEGWPHRITPHGALEAFAGLGQAVVDAERALRDYARYGDAQGWASILAMLRHLMGMAQEMAAQGREQPEDEG